VTSAENTSLPTGSWIAAAPQPGTAPRRRLFRKYALLFVGLVGAALLINSGFDFWFSYQENQAALIRIQQEKAASAAQRIAEFVTEIRSQLGWTTHAQWDSGPLDQRRQDYVRLLRQVPAVTEVSQLDATGKEQLKVSRLAMDVVGSGADFSQDPRFTEAKAHRVWFSPVYFRKQSEPYMTLAMARDGRNAGVTVAEINLKLIWDVITALKIGQSGYAYVVDERGRLIAHPDISLVLRESDLSTLPQVTAALSPGPEAPAAAVARSLDGRSVLTAHAAIAPLGWQVFVELPLREAFAPLYGAALRTGLLLLFGLLAAALAALLLARRMTGPIRAIADGAARIGAGDLARRIDIHTGDELEGLATQFNRMAGDLQKSYGELEQRVADRTAELSEALDQQTATAEVLQVINASPGDLAPVFDAMLEKAIGLCDAAAGTMLRRDGDRFSAVASRGASPAFADFLSRGPLSMPSESSTERVGGGEPFVHFPDVAAEAHARQGVLRTLTELSGARTYLAVPLRKDAALLGVFCIYRLEVRPFSDKQIALVQNFAAQAVIAMENARLITETQEALEQQTATAEVLQVINSSPGSLAPVFDAMLEKGVRLAEAGFGILCTFDGERFRTAAMRGLPIAYAEFLAGNPLSFAPGSGPASVLAGQRYHTVADFAADPLTQSGDPHRRALVELGGARTGLAVPLRKDTALLGILLVFRPEVRPFTEKQIALLENFAAQAVIAIENARLITETQEALEQQTATAEVLQVINSSPGDLAPIFRAMLDKATRVCDADMGTLWTLDGDRLHAAALHGAPRAYADFVAREAPQPGPTAMRTMLAGGLVHLIDLPATEPYQRGQPLVRAMVDLAGVRTVLGVPLVKEGKTTGIFGVYRRTARPFTDKQIALLQNFAAQAVIAMENARLITETREALEQQTATAEVLGVINSSPGDLAPVFDAILEKAHTLCGAALGSLRIMDGDHLRVVAVRTQSGPYAEEMRRGYFSSDAPATKALLGGAPFVHIPDVAQLGDPFSRGAVERSGVRTLLAVPLRKEERLLGAIFAGRQEVRPFTDKQIALLQNFAAQAVIAMENARLISETREALEQQTATAEVLQVINSSPGDLAPVFDAILEKAHTLCGADHGNLTIYDGEHFRAVATHQMPERFTELLRQPFRPYPGGPQERLLGGEPLIHIPDQAAREPTNPVTRAAIDAGVRTLLFVPLRRDDALLGYITAHRQEARPFSGKQIALLQNFAAQAVIAMENARLITETREALEQQTATAEVLGVINSSPGDLAPVFEAMLEKALRLCGAAYGNLLRYDDEQFQVMAVAGGAAAGGLGHLFRPVPGTVLSAIVDGDNLAFVEDLLNSETYRAGSPLFRELVDREGFRSVLDVALRKESTLLGVISIFRKETGPFTDKQIALLQNFAAQAVIAMENARLITETREALAQQTATAEVLGVINSSPGDLAPVFDAMLERATRLCEPAFGFMLTWDGECFHRVAWRGVPPDLARQESLAPQPGAPGDRILRGENIVSITDLAQDQAIRDTPNIRRLVSFGGRSYIAVALRKDNKLLGSFAIYRREVRPFSDKEIALLQNFAAQAVIAMENARLIAETREALDQQTATAEVLQVINSSPGDLAPVFDAILEKAHSLCDAAHGSLQVYDGEYFRAVATHGHPTEFAALSRQPRRPRGFDHWLLRGDPLVHVPDLAALATSDRDLDSPRFRASIAAGIRTLLRVPLRSEHGLLGYIAAYRQEVRPFSDKQIALLQNFAAQAVIAMENARLITETREALEQQTATAEVLGVINSSPGDLAPVFDAMLERAMRLCAAAYGHLMTYDNGTFTAVASRGGVVDIGGSVRPQAGYVLDRLVQGEDVVHATKVFEDPAYLASPSYREWVDRGGVRAFLIVALRKAGALLGMIGVYGREERPFSDKQIALLQNFAAQAVIAMENARLITETREALEQQTATAEVLQVINSSPGDLAPVFDAILEKARGLCGAAQGALVTYDGEHFRAVATHGQTAEFAERLSQPFRPAPGGPQQRLLRGERLVHVPDVSVFADADPVGRAAVERGIRTLLMLPLRKDDVLFGYIAANRLEVRPFSDKQIALLENFAAQAVIAMENARLLTELRQRTGDLQESLEYQTATSDVLRVISQSGGELEPVLDTLVRTAARLCDAEMALIHRREGGIYRPSAVLGFPAEFAAYLDAHPLIPGRGSIAGRVALEGCAIHIPDVAADPEYELSQSIAMAKQRTALGVPLLREDVPIGVIVLARQRVQPFTEKEIALVTTFADQAVIAIENARLFNELRARTAELGRSVDELKMLSEVGQAVSSTLDLRAVLSTILTRSVGLIGAEAGVIFRYSRAERAFRFVEAVGYTEAMVRDVRALDVGENVTGMGQAVASRVPLQIPDLRERPPNPLRDQAIAAGYRSVLIVPLVGADRILGATILQRRAVGEFPETAVRLMQTLASQSVLAIQNARLFREIADKSEQLRLASQHKSQFLANMSHELRTPMNAILGYAELLVDGIYGALPARAMGVLERVQNNGKHLLALINDVLDLSKIEAGQLVLTLEDYTLPDVVQSVVTATEALASTKGLKMTATVAPGLPTGHGDARRLAQVLLNLVGNAVKFTDRGEVAIGAVAENGHFVLTVRDTGPGIAPEDHGKIFEEFQQVDSSNTRKKGGTGLGLAISKRMVEMQGGTIVVDSELGKGATFRVTLPVRVEDPTEELMGAA
jgi:GAF domain-containing protein/HAMP domain-containing protein